MNSPEQGEVVAPRPAFARWIGTTNDVTRRFLAAGRIPGLINIAGGLPAPEIYAAAELAFRPWARRREGCRARLEKGL